MWVKPPPILGSRLGGKEAQALFSKQLIINFYNSIKKALAKMPRLQIIY